LCLTHWNRFNLLLEAISLVEDDPRIGEIIISDDASTDGSYQQLLVTFADSEKVRIHRNEQRLDCYLNKARAVALSPNPWLILFDSDNVLEPGYLDALEALEPWDQWHWYLPTYAKPDFDYRAFAGAQIDKANIREYVDVPFFLTALNTANHFVHRDGYLQAFDENADPGTADSIFMALRWIECGGTLHFVEGMEYTHRIHDGSHFMTFNSPRYERFKAQVIERLRDVD
jgi:glycosyltransferase involved in cell wall biosynthesis